MNAFIEQNRDNLPVEFQLTGVVPDPWTARTVVLRWAQVGLSSVRGHAINEIQLARNVSELGADEANRRFAPDPWDDLEIPAGLDVDIISRQVLDAMRAGDGDPFSGDSLPALQVVEQYSHLTPAIRTAQVSNPQIATEGSNNWVMSGARSPTGIPILANDPHRRIEMPALRYFVHLNAPGWNVMGGGEPPFVGVDAGHNERMAWGFTFAGTDMVDVYVEEINPQDRNQVRWQNGWETLQVIEEEIRIKDETPRTVQLKFSRHGPIIFEDRANNVAYSVRSVVREPGTAAYKGSFKLAQANSCEDFFERAMFWMVPTHSLICGDVLGNIALQVTGLTPNRVGWNGRLPVPGTGQFEWQGFREDLPREFNPDRGYITTANNNVHPPGYDGRPVFYHTSRDVETSRVTRLHQILGTGDQYSVEDHQAIQHDSYSLRAELDIPGFQGWTSEYAQVERARALVAEWDGVLDRDSTAAAIYVEWTRQVDATALDSAANETDRTSVIEDGLQQTLSKLTADWGSDWSAWNYGRGNPSALPHMFIPDFDLAPVERPGGFGTVNATGANFRRIIDLSNLDNSVATNAPGQSAQPGSPFYGDLAERLGNGEYFPFLFTRGAIEEVVAHRLMLNPE